MRQFIISLRVLRDLHCHSIPSFQSISDPLRVRPIERGLAQMVTFLAALKVHSCIVFLPRVHSDGDGNLFALPAGGGAFSVFAGKFSHDVGVILLNRCVWIVFFVECEA